MTLIDPAARADTPSPELRVRLGVPGEATAITLLVNRAYEDEWPIFGEGRDRTDLEEVRAGFDDPAVFYLGVEQQKRLVASARVEIQEDGLYFGMLAVDPGCQGRGLGRLMVARIEEDARRRGLEFVRLVCIREKNLPAYYGRMGYVATSEEGGRIWGALDVIHVTHMEKRLV